MTAILISLGLCCCALLALVRACELLGEGGEYRPTRRQLRAWRRNRLRLNPRMRQKKRFGGNAW